MRSTSVSRLWRASLVLLALVISQPRAQAQPAPAVTFEQIVSELGDADSGVRLRAVQALRQAAYPEAAAPLARAVGDSDDSVQLEAMAAELNIFAAEHVASRRRVGLVVEVRDRTSAVGMFNAGPNVLNPSPVPADVLTALRTATHDDNPRVSAEAIYAFGILAENVYGQARQTLLAASSSEFADALVVPHADVRGAAIRVIARVFGWRVGDAAVDQKLGDAVVTALNDNESAIRLAAMDALGALRYDRGVQSLTELYQHYQRGTMAAAALGALARIAHPGSVPLFVDALNGRDASLRVPAIEGLARAGASDQLPAISSVLLKERNPDVLLAGTFASALLSDGPVDDLVGGLANSRLRVRAKQYLIDIAPGRARLFGPHVPDPQAALRIDLLEVLGVSGDADALSIVQPLTQDQDPAVARAASRASARLQGTTALQP